MHFVPRMWTALYSVISFNFVIDVGVRGDLGIALNGNFRRMLCKIITSACLLVTSATSSSSTLNPSLAQLAVVPVTIATWYECAELDSIRSAIWFRFLEPLQKKSPLLWYENHLYDRPDVRFMSHTTRWSGKLKLLLSPINSPERRHLEIAPVGGAVSHL